MPHWSVTTLEGPECLRLCRGVDFLVITKTRSDTCWTAWRSLMAIIIFSAWLAYHICESFSIYGNSVESDPLWGAGSASQQLARKFFTTHIVSFDIRRSLRNLEGGGITLECKRDKQMVDVPGGCPSRNITVKPIRGGPRWSRRCCEPHTGTAVVLMPLVAFVYKGYKRAYSRWQTGKPGGKIERLEDATLGPGA